LGLWDSIATGEMVVNPVVTFGGDTIYFETFNTADVGLHQTGPSAAQPRIAVTYLSLVEREPAAWSREIEVVDYETSTGVARLASGDDGYLVYPDYRHHPVIPQPIDHNVVRVKVQLGAAVPEGMLGTVHLAWYDPDNTMANVPGTPPANVGHGLRDNAASLAEAGDPLPGFTLRFTTEGPSPTSDAIQKAYLAIEDARYGDNFIVVAHPHEGIADTFEFRENESQELVLMRPANTGLWHELPDDDDPADDPADGVQDHRTSVLTIIPSVDIDADSYNTGTIDRSDREEEIENEAAYSGTWVAWNGDDDNENGIADYLENAEYEYPPGISWVPFTDDDLVPVVLDRGFEDLSGMDDFVFELKVTLGRGLSYWLDPEKTPISADEYETITEGGNQKGVYRWFVSSEAVSYPPLIYVGGIDPGALTDTLMWRLLKRIPSDPPGGDSTYELIHEDTVKMTDPWAVDLDIDSDNNGYINDPGKNAAAAFKENQMEESVPKPITFFGNDSPHPVSARRIPATLRITNSVSGRQWSIHYTPNLKVYREENGQLVHEPTTTLHPAQTGTQAVSYWVEAIGSGPTGFPSGLDKIHVVLWDSNDQEVGRDTVVLKVQDNVQHITEWVIPNDWRIDGETLTTPTPEEPLSYPEQSGKTLGPQIEGTGRDYNVYNKGDAYTRAAYPNGFEIKVAYEFTTGYVQADTKRDQLLDGSQGTDARKVSFVANSGIKFGPLTDGTIDSRYEVAIIDLHNWLGLTSGVQSLLIDPKGKILDYNGPAPNVFEAEDLNRLLPGILYAGQYTGLTDADGFPDPSTWTAVHYRTLLERAVNCWDNSSMMVRVDPMPMTELSRYT
jgi:hypothetical protein